MLSLTLIKEAIGQIGIPATVVAAIVASFHTGIIPSKTSGAYEQVDVLATEVRNQQELVKLIVKQHGEQMELLMLGMREICFNTAKSPDRERACGNLQSRISEKP